MNIFSQEKVERQFEIETDALHLSVGDYNLSAAYLYCFQTQIGLSIGVPRFNYYFKEQLVLEPFLKSYFSEEKENAGSFIGLSFPIAENEQNKKWSVYTTLSVGYKWLFKKGWTISYQAECAVNYQTGETTRNLLGLRVGKRFGF